MVGAPQHASSHNSLARIFTCLIADERNEFTLQSELCLEGLRESLLDKTTDNVHLLCFFLQDFAEDKYHLLLIVLYLAIVNT